MIGDALERVGQTVDREIFRPTVESALKEARRQAKGPGGIPEEWKTTRTATSLPKRIPICAVKSANVHDSHALTGLIDEKDRVLYADSACSGKDLPASLPETLKLNVPEKGARNRPLTDEQEANGKVKSKIRVRIEHIFGFMTVSMHEITLRCIGKHRADFNIGFMDLVYNICRAEILSRVGA